MALPSSRRRPVIYGLFDPLSGHLRYVGKTTNIRRRIEAHHRFGRSFKYKRYRLYRWVGDLLKQGMKPEFFILQKVRRGECANQLEREWIASMRLAGCDLLNLTDGGDGQSVGYVWSEESRQKLRMSLRGRKFTDVAKANLRRAFNTPEMRELRRRNTEKLKRENPEWRFKIGSRHRGKTLSPAHREKISAKWTPERKAAHAAEKSALPVDERWRTQLRTALENRWRRDKGKPLSAEHKAAMLAGSLARWERWRQAGKPKLGSPKRVRRYEHAGVSLSLSEWAERTGLKSGTIKARLKKGWTLAEALTQPTSWKPRSKREQVASHAHHSRAPEQGREHDKRQGFFSF